jgi:hypothetical protein
MSSLIVIRIVPQTPTDPLSFSSALAADGGLKVTVATLSFDSVNNQPPGANSVTASYIALTPSGGWSVSDGSVFPQGAVIASSLPPYPSGLTGGIIQQVDYVPSPDPIIDPNPAAELQAVATAVLQVPWTAPQLENISVTATRGTESIALDVDYYVLTPNPTAVPDLSTWAPPSNGTIDLWAQLAANLYLSLPPVPPSNPAAAFQMPSDGTAPPFDGLLTAVKAILALDPGTTAATATVVAPGATAGATQLPFGAAPANVTVGMAASGTGIAAGTIVLGVSGGTVTLSQEVGAAGVAAGTIVSFTPSLGSLTLDQCQNIAYELLWTQQQPLPTPPDPIENLYTNPPNNGELMSSGSSVNQLEGDRQQFEAQLKTYYASPNANADRLTTYVYALSAAVACEQTSLAATQALIQFPSQPGSSSTNSASDQSVILTALDTIAGPAHFGVPAAYFYAIAGATPTSRNATQRYGDATGDQRPDHLGWRILRHAGRDRHRQCGPGGAADLRVGHPQRIEHGAGAAQHHRPVREPGADIGHSPALRLRRGAGHRPCRHRRRDRPGHDPVVAVDQRQHRDAVGPGGLGSGGRRHHRLHPRLLGGDVEAGPGLARLPDRGGRGDQQPILCAGRRRRFVLAERGHARAAGLSRPRALRADRRLHHSRALLDRARQRDPHLSDDDHIATDDRHAGASHAGAVDHALQGQPHLAAAAAGRHRRADQRLHGGAPLLLPGQRRRAGQHDHDRDQRGDGRRRKGPDLLSERRRDGAARLERDLRAHHILGPAGDPDRDPGRLGRRHRHHGDADHSGPRGDPGAHRHHFPSDGDRRGRRRVDDIRSGQ